MSQERCDSIGGVPTDETPEERIVRLEAMLLEMYEHQQVTLALGLYEEAEETRWNIDDTMFALARAKTEVTSGGR
ncbi:hypothetical protein [Haloferax sulfurifontis]|uniref:Uncharacterized protein n=1 Tax=Haloferax sulfurifontis TaxID=255616 RepID=A0A830DTX5_9EURY|nr:hypothetical protein [Haloferax sulfurifontis]GGC49736.1 hypothetical protein GCM10007209_09230 [Haloferax sulfurifontis]